MDKRKFVQIFLLVVVAVKLTSFILLHRDYYLKPFDPIYMGKLYSQSQYVVGERSKGGIGDDGLYAFAGYYYLSQMGDVSAVNFEHPPLGKYLIGLSILLFKNENVINIIYFLLLLSLTYKIGEMILRDKILALLAVGILTFDGLFLDNLLRSMLDLPFTLFFLAGVYFFLIALRNSKYYWLSSGLFAAAFATRFFPAIILVYTLFLASLFIYHPKAILQFLFSTISVPLMYLVVHASFFFYHPSLVEFLRHKKWMLSWFTGSPDIIGNIWRNIFTGTYIDATGKLASNSFWTPLIPIIVVLALLSWRQVSLKKRDEAVSITYGLCLAYLLYVTLLTMGVQKFIMPIYPLLIILSISNVNSLYSIIVEWKKHGIRR